MLPPRLLNALLVVGVASVMLTPSLVYAQNCMELGTCSITSIFDFMSTPYTLTFGDWGFVLIWGLVIAVVQLRSRNIMLTGFVGVFIASFFLATTASVVTSQALYVGATLLAASVGFVMYQLWKNRLNMP